jgi:hypothetical protein
MEIKVWNTGRRYSVKGQRIAACLVGNTVHFHDYDRMVSGQFKVDTTPTDLQHTVMRVYDAPGVLREDGGYEYPYEYEGIWTEIQKQLMQSIT